MYRTLAAPTVTGSGARPASDPPQLDPEHMSIVHCSKSFRIESVNCPRMKRSDPLLRNMVHTCTIFTRALSSTRVSSRANAKESDDSSRN